MIAVRQLCVNINIFNYFGSFRSTEYLWSNTSFVSVFVIQTVWQHCMQIFKALRASEICPVPDFVGLYSSLKPTLISLSYLDSQIQDLEKYKHSPSVNKKNAWTGDGE